jgi:hypothetical protein
MDRDRPRWRIRIGTLMLLVIIVAVSMALIVERRKRLQAEENNRLLSSHVVRLLKSEIDLQARLEAVVAKTSQAGSGVIARSQRPTGESPGRATMTPRQ